MTARSILRFSVTLILLVGACRASNSALPAAAPLATQVQPLGAPAQYGLSRLEAALKAHGKALPDGQIVIGTYASIPVIQKWTDDKSLPLAKQPESLAVKKIGGQLVVAGFDDVGLMYALLDIADQVKHAKNADSWLKKVAERSESPRNQMRRMRVMMHHAANEKDWYHSTEYWDWYIGMLATNRFNGLNLVYSHQTPYMAPMYAWHVKVDEFPNVRAKGVSDEQREENLKVMRHIAKICHDRGIELTIGVWQHLPWKESYVVTREDQESLVEGLDEKNVADYTYLAVKKLLKECPGIARIQLRPNDESGIHLSDQTKFYRDNVMRAIKEFPNVKLDLRTVGVQQRTIQAARDADLGVRTSIKYFGEFMSLPYPPVQTVTEGYSYGDYLRKPMPNPVYNEVWVLGSHRILLWGSEGYGREFGRNASYGGTSGFETDGPLAQKGYQKPMTPAWRIFNNKEDEYYTHEIERYWAFFRSIGRFGYNPETPREVWLRPFNKRFGDASEAMADAYEAASQVIGLIVASHIENPNMYTWPEISMGGLLSAYTALNGMDRGLFPSIDTQVEEELAGKTSGRFGAKRLANLYEAIASRVDSSLASADRAAGEKSKEYIASSKDFQILAHLARYHAHRQREGYGMAKFYRTGDASLIAHAMHESEQSVKEWKKLVEIATPLYYPHMQTAPVENGHWKDKVFLVETNPKIIQEALETIRTHGLFEWGFDFAPTPLRREIKVFSVWQYGNDYQRERRFVGLSPNDQYNPRLGYGFLGEEDLRGTAHPMSTTRNLIGGAPVSDQSQLPLNLLTGDFIYSNLPMRFRIDLPMDGFRMTFVFADKSAKPKDHGPFDIRRGAEGRSGTYIKDIRVPAGETVYKQIDQHIRQNGWDPYWTFALTPAGEGADAIISGLTIHRQAPAMAHAPPERLEAAKPCSLSVTITMPPRVAGKDGKPSAASGDRLHNAVLKYRTDAEATERTIALKSEDGLVYSAVFDAPKGKWLEYTFTATDESGRTTRLPAATSAEPFRIRLTRDTLPPRVEHKPILTHKAGQPMRLEVKATDPDGVAAVRAYYRPLDESLPYDCVVLERKGNQFVGNIPGEAIRDDLDFVYYLHAIDESGNGVWFPDWQKTMPYTIVKTMP